jgi:hypothetical protein
MVRGPFKGLRQTTRRNLRNLLHPHAVEPEQRFVILHIGKTGGTSLKFLISDLKTSRPKLPISKVDHHQTIYDVLTADPTAQIGFVIRDPTDRFVSGFNSRLRSGRPDHSRPWSAEEAIVYSFFPTATSLAEALDSSDERMRSAADFAMKTILHLRLDYRHFLGDPDKLSTIRSSIYCVCDLKELSERVSDFFAPLGVSPDVVHATFKVRHRSPQSVAPLSELGLSNLKRVWADEYDLYDYCMKNLT